MSYVFEIIHSNYHYPSTTPILPHGDQSNESHFFTTHAVRRTGLFRYTICRSAASSAAALQPFVQKHELAGASFLLLIGTRWSRSKLSVTLISGRTSDEARCGVLDRLAIEADYRGRGNDACRRRKIALDDPVEKYLPEFRGQMVVAEKDANPHVLRKPDIRSPFAKC